MIIVSNIISLYNFKAIYKLMNLSQVIFVLIMWVFKVGELFEKVEMW